MLPRVSPRRNCRVVETPLSFFLLFSSSQPGKSYYNFWKIGCREEETERWRKGHAGDPKVDGVFQMCTKGLHVNLELQVWHQKITFIAFYKKMCLLRAKNVKLVEKCVLLISKVLLLRI